MVVDADTNQAHIPYNRWMWHRHMGDVTPEAWAYELDGEGVEEIKDQIRYVLEERFFGDACYTAEDLIALTDELTEALQEMTGCGNDPD